MEYSGNYQLSFCKISNQDTVFNYVVIVSFYQGELVWVRQKGRDTWEIPGGHVEKDETPNAAAERELVEETGAVYYTIFPLCDFKLVTPNGSSYNRLYIAEIEEIRSNSEYEIEEVRVFAKHPPNLTHGTIQLKLIEEAKRISPMR